MLRKILYLFLALILLLVVAYLLGPRYPETPFDNNPIQSSYGISNIESQFKLLNKSSDPVRPGNEAELIWYQDSIAQTEYSMVYLHGFGASKMEGEPLHRNLANTFGCNLILARLPDHGVEVDEKMLDLQTSKLIDHSKKIIALASEMGKKVIIVSTSTGSTLASYLAANDDRIHSLIMLAPNFGIPDFTFDLLDRPWGLQLAQWTTGSKYHVWEANEEIQKYWYNHYRLEALVVLDQLLGKTMTKDVFSKITIPFFIGYYYKDEENKDDVIDIDMISIFAEASNTEKQKTKVMAFSDATGHVIGSELMNPNWKSVENEIIDYCVNVLQLKKVKEKPKPEEVSKSSFVPK